MPSPILIVSSPIELIYEQIVGVDMKYSNTFKNIQFNSYVIIIPTNADDAIKTVNIKERRIYTAFILSTDQIINNRKSEHSVSQVLKPVPNTCSSQILI